jgi:hypothetical protein
VRRKLSWTVLIIGVFISVYFVWKNYSVETQPVKEAEKSYAKDSLPASIDFEGSKYLYNYFEVMNPSDLSLIPNFTEKKSADEVFEEFSCRALVSAGFYTKENSPAGLFISAGKTLRGYIKNSTFNAILSINDFSVPRITRNVPRDGLVNAVQTGPLLIENANALSVKLANDKSARRVVALVTGENRLYFLIIYSPTQLFGGPYITDLPGILSQIGKKEGIVWADAVNLDGGSASAFMTAFKKTGKDDKFSELSPVGSFFCLK